MNVDSVDLKFRTMHLFCYSAQSAKTRIKYQVCPQYDVSTLFFNCRTMYLFGLVAQSANMCMYTYTFFYLLS